MAEKFEALAEPPLALEKGGTEVLRVAIVEGGLHVSLQRAFDEPEVWGVLLADIARHAARVFATEQRISEDDALAGIRAMFDAELDRPTDPGTTHAVS
jgi:hypothetical protein